MSFSLSLFPFASSSICSDCLTKTMCRRLVGINHGTADQNLKDPHHGSKLATLSFISTSWLSIYLCLFLSVLHSLIVFVSVSHSLCICLSLSHCICLSLSISNLLIFMSVSLSLSVSLCLSEVYKKITSLAGRYTGPWTVISLLEYISHLWYPDKYGKIRE